MPLALSISIKSTTASSFNKKSYKIVDSALSIKCLL